MSRILRKFAKQRWIEKKASRQDARLSLLSLTKQGRKVFSPLNARSTEQVSAIIGQLLPTQQEDLLRAMHTIESVLAPGSEELGSERNGIERKSDGRTYLLRPHRPGDMRWVVHRHGVLYLQEYRYDERFEALVAGIVSEDPREELWREMQPSALRRVVSFPDS